MDINTDAEILEKAIADGATEDEIDATIRTGKDLNSESGDLGKTKTFPFFGEKDNEFVEQKKLDVYFSVENKIITTIRIDVSYGTFS